MSLKKHLDSSCAGTHVSIISNKAVAAGGLKTHHVPFCLLPLEATMHLAKVRTLPALHSDTRAKR